MLIDSQRYTLVCTNCGLCRYYPVCVTPYNHTMQPLRRKCVCKRSDNFKVILNQFFYGGKQLVPDDVMDTIRNEIHNRDNMLYNYTIPPTIPILECILKRCKMMKYKNSMYRIFFKGQLQRFHKLISDDRIWPSEHGFEVIYEKSLFVFEISVFKVRNKRGIHSRFHSFSENNNRETVCDVTSNQSSMITIERSDLRDRKASGNC